MCTMPQCDCGQSLSLPLSLFGVNSAWPPHPFPAHSETKTQKLPSWTCKFLLLSRYPALNGAHTEERGRTESGKCQRKTANTRKAAPAQAQGRAQQADQIVVKNFSCLKFLAAN